MLWIDDGKGGGECTVGLMRLSVYISPTSGGRCFRVAFRHGEEWDTYAWGSTELPHAEAREFAENVAREAVTNGALRGDTSADAVMAKIALFSPVIGDELESIRRTMIEVVDELVSDAVRSEVALAMSTVVAADGHRVDRGVDYEALAKLGFEALQPGSRWLDQDWDVRQRWLDVARVMVAAFERTMGGESCSSRQR